MLMKSTPHITVAVASSPLGPFHFARRWHPPAGERVGDISAMIDPHSGRAVLAYSVKPTLPNNTIRFLRLAFLNADLLRAENLLSRISEPVAIIQQKREAPALFYESKRQRYGLLVSRATGWTPNAAELFSAPVLSGPWTSEGNPTHNATSFSSQPTFVLPVAKGGIQRFIYIADRFIPHIIGPLCGSSLSYLCESGRYVWLPMQTAAWVHKDALNMTVKWRSEWRIDDLFIHGAQ